jgi:AcrR family transcriptional regulator
VAERQRDAARTRAEILAVATAEFAERGYAGARIDEIADRMRTTKRMIYYYFGSKEQLFVAVLEQAYSEIRVAEQQLQVEGLEPVAAIRRLAELTYDHHTAHPDFLRLVSIENIHRGVHLATSERLGSLANPVLDLISTILDAGVAAGVFRVGVDPLDIHMVISSYCVFPVANRYTFREIFGRDLLDPERHEGYRRLLGEMVVAYLTAGVK